MNATVKGSDGKLRCAWSGSAPEFDAYHDAEWGFAVGDDRRLFEKICLESFQSGLSWRTILSKRDNFRRAFDGFDYHMVAGYGADKVAALLQDAGIIRHRGKIEATVNNAARAVEMERSEGSLAAFFWRYEVLEPPEPQTVSTCAESVALSRDLKKRGWKFVGPTTCFAFMQAMGLVNDHATGCYCRPLAEDARKSFSVPTGTTP